MQKFLFPSALAIALTVGGAAFAGSASTAGGGHSAIYDRPNPFAAAGETTAMEQPVAGTVDPTLRPYSQRASTVDVPEPVWSVPAPTAREDLDHPE